MTVHTHDNGSIKETIIAERRHGYGAKLGEQIIGYFVSNYNNLESCQ